MAVAFIDGKQVDAATAQASGMFSSSQIASLTPSTSNPISYSSPAPSPTPAKPAWSWFLGGSAATDAQKSYAQSKGISFDQAAYEMNQQKTPTNSYTTVTGNQVTTDSTGKIITTTKPIEWVTIPEQTSTTTQNPLSANYIPDTNIKIPNILNDVNFKTGKVGVLTDKQKQELNIAFGRASGGTGTQEDYANLKNAIEQYGWRPTGLSDMNKWDLTDFVDEEKGSDIKTSDLSWENIEWITSKAWLEDENIKSVVDKYEKQMSDIVNQKVDDISKKMNSLYEKIDTLSTKMQTEMDYMNIPQLYKSAMEAFDLAGKLKTSSDIANSLQSMLTTVWEDVPWQGRVAKQIISANAYGKVAGLTAAYNIAKDNVTTGSWLINNYYQGLSNTLTQRMSTLQWLLNSNSTMYANLSQDEKSYIQAQLNILQNQANEYTSTWEMISEFTKDPAFIYAEPFDLDNETQESAAKKISEAKFKYSYAQETLKQYPDAKIDASMSLSAMQDAVKKSAIFASKGTWETSPTSYKEWMLAGWESGTGKTYSEWLTKEKSWATSDVVKQIMDINTKFVKDTTEVKSIISNASLINEFAQEMQDQQMTQEDINRSPKIQAIVTLFNKILDPNSVVREGEYDRTIVWQGMMDRIKGWYESLTKGGQITQSTINEVANVSSKLATVLSIDLVDNANLAIGWASDLWYDKTKVLPSTTLEFVNTQNAKNFAEWYSWLDVNTQSGVEKMITSIGRKLTPEEEIQIMNYYKSNI